MSRAIYAELTLKGLEKVNDMIDEISLDQSAETVSNGTFSVKFIDTYSVLIIVDNDSDIELFLADRRFANSSTAIDVLDTNRVDHIIKSHNNAESIYNVRKRVENQMSQFNDILRLRNIVQTRHPGRSNNNDKTYDELAEEISQEDYRDYIVQRYIVIRKKEGYNVSIEDATILYNTGVRSFFTKALGTI